MKTELYTASKIFSECIFRIPDYQRGYSWEDDQLKDFWTDIEQLQVDKSHYTGVLTLEPVPESVWASWEDDKWIIKSRKYSPYYVVDGQQRLTTIVILIYCISQSAKQSELNFTPVDLIRRKFICETRGDLAARSYIFGYEKDNPSYEFLKTEIFEDHSENHSVTEGTVYTRNLRAAKEFFSEKVASLSVVELELLFTKVTQQLVFNVYEITKEIDVFVAFETMNNRGKPLSALELLKNRLIYLATHSSETEDGDRARLRKLVNEAWKTAYHCLGRNERRPLQDDVFLTSHLSYFYFSQLSPELPSESEGSTRYMGIAQRLLRDPEAFLLGMLFTRKRPEKAFPHELPPLSAALIQSYAKDLKQAVILQFKLSTPSESKFSAAEKVSLERIGRLRGHDASPLMLSVFSREKNGLLRARFLEALERYLFMNSFRHSPRIQAEYRNTPLEVVRYLKGKLSIDELITYYNNATDGIYKESPLVEVLEEWVKQGVGYYGFRSIKFFLFEYELDLMGRSKSEREKISWEEFVKEDFGSDYESVEHIYPQRARHEYWTERFGDLTTQKRSALRNSLENLVALSKPKNSSLSNKPFPEKVLGSSSGSGYRFGSYSENEVALSSDWGVDEIAERGIRMLEFMERRWKIAIGDADQKRRALGLRFLIEKPETAARKLSPGLKAHL